MKFREYLNENQYYSIRPTEHIEHIADFFERGL